MTIRTRANPLDMTDMVVGHGPHIIAMSDEQLELLAALLGMVKLGSVRPHQIAALELLDSIETLTDDPDYPSRALALIQPMLEVYDDQYTMVRRYDADYNFEIIV